MHVFWLEWVTVCARARACDYESDGTDGFDTGRNTPVLQCAAVCCSALQRVAARSSAV